MPAAFCAWTKRRLNIFPTWPRATTISEDGLTFTFKLREGMMWSDGEPITANDFKWTYDMANDPDNGYPYRSQLDFITSYEALDDYTLEVEDRRDLCPGARPDVRSDHAVAQTCLGESGLGRSGNQSGDQRARPLFPVPTSWSSGSAIRIRSSKPMTCTGTRAAQYRPPGRCDCARSGHRLRNDEERRNRHRPPSIPKTWTKPAHWTTSPSTNGGRRLLSGATLA